MFYIRGSTGIGSNENERVLWTMQRVLVGAAVDGKTTLQGSFSSGTARVVAASASVNVKLNIV